MGSDVGTVKANLSLSFSCKGVVGLLTSAKTIKHGITVAPKNSAQLEFSMDEAEAVVYKECEVVWLQSYQLPIVPHLSPLFDYSLSSTPLGFCLNNLSIGENAVVVMVVMMYFDIMWSRLASGIASGAVLTGIDCNMGLQHLFFHLVWTVSGPPEFGGILGMGCLSTDAMYTSEEICYATTLKPKKNHETTPDIAKAIDFFQQMDDKVKLLKTTPKQLIEHEEVQLEASPELSSLHSNSFLVLEGSLQAIKGESMFPSSTISTKCPATANVT
ncbi:hypothetical protein STEG23_038053, partial [Scotinomys teguina]